MEQFAQAKFLDLSITLAKRLEALARNAIEIMGSCPPSGGIAEIYLSDRQVSCTEERKEVCVALYKVTVVC